MVSARATAQPLGFSPRTLVPWVGAAVVACTVAAGLALTASRVELGAPLAPFLSRWAPGVGPWALVSAAALVLAVALGPRLLAGSLSPAAFAGFALLLGLALRLALGVAGDGPSGLWSVYAEPNFEAANEYLPALPALDFGLRFFLDTFAEVGTSLTVNAIGHPPGLLSVLHLLGIDSAEGMAALTIGVGVLSVPLTYLLGRSLLDEGDARVATLLYLLAPSAVLFGATSADALYVTLGLAAVLGLVAARRRWRVVGSAAFAVASFFSWANLGLGALATVLTARRDGLRAALGVAAGCGAALVLGYGLLHLASGYDPFGALASVESVYREGIASTRPYAFWAFGSPVAFLVALGLPTAWLALKGLGAGDAVALGLFSVLLTAAVLGFTKAETERIYLFLVPFACLAAARFLPSRALPAVLAALAAQALASELLLDTIW